MMNKRRNVTFRKEDATWPIAGLGKVTFACFTYKQTTLTSSDVMNYKLKGATVGSAEMLCRIDLIVGHYAIASQQGQASLPF